MAYCYKLNTRDATYRDAIYKACIAAGGLKGNRSNPTPEKGYYVLKHTKMPAVLMEYGFMDSKTDAPVILTDGYAKKVAYATMEAIAQVAGLEKDEPEKKAAVKVDGAKSYNKAKAGKYLVNTPELNLRTGASTEKQILEVMPKGKVFTCYGYYTGSWLYGISASGKKGFCHGSYLKKK